MRVHTGSVKWMTTVTASHRSIVAIVFLVGGALQVLGAVLGLAQIGNSGAFYLLSNLALGAGFVLLFAWYAASTVARVAYLVAAVGWLLLALGALVSLGVVGTLALFIAVIGSVFSGVIVFTGHVFGRLGDILFLAAMIAGALNLLASQNSNVPAVLKAALVVLFGALLVVWAVLLLGNRATKSV
jgi:hypothetical protein